RTQEYEKFVDLEEVERRRVRGPAGQEALPEAAEKVIAVLEVALGDLPMFLVQAGDLGVVRTRDRRVQDLIEIDPPGALDLEIERGEHAGALFIVDERLQLLDAPDEPRPLLGALREAARRPLDLLQEAPHRREQEEQRGE